MKVDYFRSFDRSFKKLDAPVQKSIQRAIQNFLEDLVLSRRSQGLGLRRLHHEVWEIRVGLQYRVLFELKKDWVSFIFVGNHDQVRRFLKDL